MEYHFNTLPNFGVLEVKLEQKHIDLLYSYIKETAYPGYEFDGNTVTAHAKDNQWSLIDRDGVFVFFVRHIYRTHERIIHAKCDNPYIHIPFVIAKRHKHIRSFGFTQGGRAAG